MRAQTVGEIDACSSLENTTPTAISRFSISITYRTVSGIYAHNFFLFLATPLSLLDLSSPTKD